MSRAQPDEYVKRLHASIERERGLVVTLDLQAIEGLVEARRCVDQHCASAERDDVHHAKALRELDRLLGTEPNVAYPDDLRQMLRDIARDEMCEFDKVAGHHLDKVADVIADKIWKKISTTIRQRARVQDELRENLIAQRDSAEQRLLARAQTRKDVGEP